MITPRVRAPGDNGNAELLRAQGALSYFMLPVRTAARDNCLTDKIQDRLKIVPLLHLITDQQNRRFLKFRLF